MTQKHNPHCQPYHFNIRKRVTANLSTRHQPQSFVCTSLYPQSRCRYFNLSTGSPSISLLDSFPFTHSSSPLPPTPILKTNTKMINETYLKHVKYPHAISKFYTPKTSLVQTKHKNSQIAKTKKTKTNKNIGAVTLVTHAALLLCAS